jgi:hypothetical protein
MKPALFAFTAALCLLACGNACAQGASGNTIQSACKWAALAADNQDQSIFNAHMYDIGFCAGFLQAATDGHEFWETWRKEEKGMPLGFCIPGEATQGQIMKVFVKYLDEHPEELHEQVIKLFAESMGKAFPCK